MDRYGPSEDCEICGQPTSFGHLIECPVCGKILCEQCLIWHGCYDIYTDDWAEDELGDSE